jgi:poly(A) polymerase
MVEIKQKPQLHASWIDPNAKEIVRTLQKEGFTSYLVGGCVRDLLAGLHPKDYDIATSAEPNQVKRKVWGSYVIGKRFRLVLVKRGTTQYEVATFRREASAEEMQELEEMKQAAEDSEVKVSVSGENFFGTPEQDALRRDFTVNALFYDPVKNELIDFAHGLDDIQAQTIRMIGDPNVRVIEDPIRSLRAIRLAHKLKFRIEDSFREAIQKNASELLRSVLPRRREEYLKFMRLPDPMPALMELYDLGLMEIILPSLKPVFDDPTKFEIFNSYIRRMKLVCHDPSKPDEIYLALILAYTRAMENDRHLPILRDKLMRDELMVFKAEQVAVLSALDFTDSLKNIEGYKRKGQRRQQAFLRNEAFQFGLRVARADYLVSAETLLFWEQQVATRG